MVRKKALRSGSKNARSWPEPHHRSKGHKWATCRGPQQNANWQYPAGMSTARACPAPVLPAFPGGRDGKAKTSYFCSFLCRLRWQTILSHCYIAASSLRVNCLVATRTSAVSLFPPVRNAGMQRSRIQNMKAPNLNSASHGSEKGTSI